MVETFSIRRSASKRERKTEKGRRRNKFLKENFDSK
jgi:hypothetical protein